MIKIETIENYLIDRIIRRLKPGKPESARSFPYKIVIDEFIPDGCTFEVSTNTEYHRVEQYGDEKNSQNSSWVKYRLRPCSMISGLVLDW